MILILPGMNHNQTRLDLMKIRILGSNLQRHERRVDTIARSVTDFSCMHLKRRNHSKYHQCTEIGTFYTHNLQHLLYNVHCISALLKKVGERLFK